MAPKICACGKISYGERQAHEIIKDARRHCHESRRHKIPKRAYYCVLCGLWHVTKESH